ncbi:hypothetical protein ACFVEN_44300 [Streptomyces sp. NPDC057681]|uniref:hypothetical protein n=1 Tax=Streptomyces sp. NPDC057681 TaxID=3346209 RepID=UPI003696F052
MGFFKSEPFIPGEKSDEEIRQYCLEQARKYLFTQVAGAHLNDDHVERAARFATIAQAFRPNCSHGTEK